jgi:hypothetical protein
MYVTNGNDFPLNFSFKAIHLYTIKNAAILGGTRTFYSTISQTYETKKAGEADATSPGWSL